MKPSLRMALVAASIAGVISSTSAVTTSDTVTSVRVAAADIAPIARTATLEPRTFETDPAGSGQAMVPGVSTVPTPRIVGGRATRDGSCRLSGAHDATGSMTVVPGTGDTPATGRVVRFRIEVEDGLAIDPICFGESVSSILADPRGWSGTGKVGFQRVDDASYDFRLILASPDTTDSLCYPAATGGEYSCRNRDTVVLNSTRWESGTDDFRGNTETYRQYLVNHEVGHLLGEGHRACPAPGVPAPVMMQQTKGVGECTPNGWPAVDER